MVIEAAGRGRRASVSGIGAIELVFVLFFLVFGVGGTAAWIIALVEIVKYPEHVFRMAGKEKTTWILVVVLAGFIGAIVWWFGPRKDVLAVATGNPGDPYGHAAFRGPPPGWYQDPSGTGGQAWWDGQRWTSRGP